MNKPIFLFHYKMKGSKQNFGDELSPYIVESISTRKVRYAPIAASRINIVLYFCYGVLKKTTRIKFLPQIIRSLFAKEILVSTGSILGSVTSRNAVIWGTGFHSNIFAPVNARYCAVRGPITQELLKTANITPPKAVGDPAILLPLIYSEKPIKKYKLGIIPHYIHHQQINLDSAVSNVKIINLLDPIEKVIDDLTSCEMTISSSLHGLIVSHTYKIPSLWYHLKGIDLAGGSTKFYDYFQSVGIAKYMPYDLQCALTVTDIESITKTVLNNTNQAEPSYSIEKIQAGLLDSFPYELRPEFQDKLQELLEHN